MCPHLLSSSTFHHTRGMSADRTEGLSSRGAELAGRQASHSTLPRLPIHHLLQSREASKAKQPGPRLFIEARSSTT